MSPHFVPEVLPFRERQIGELSKSFAEVVRGARPDNMFLYGKPGTGKTTCSKLVLQQWNEYAQGKGLSSVGLYVNCLTYNSKYKTVCNAVQQLCNGQSYLGFSSTFVYEKLKEFVEGKKANLILVLDEIDKAKDVDELMYEVIRANDEIKEGGISVVGISNQVTFKQRLDPRTKSSMCEKELVFPPYNAVELKTILEQRVQQAFQPNVVEDSAINLASALAAQESGDARTAVTLLLRAGELAEQRGKGKVADQDVLDAKGRVEQEILASTIVSLPEQQQGVLFSLAKLTESHKGVRRLNNGSEGVLFSGEIFDEYRRWASQRGIEAVTSRWFQEYINELEMLGLLVTMPSGKGVRGNTRLIQLGMDPRHVLEILDSAFRMT